MVCRDTTERPEGIEAGFAKIIGTKVEENFKWALNNYKWSGENPYGNGNAAKKIVDSITVYSSWFERDIINSIKL